MNNDQKKDYDGKKKMITSTTKRMLLSSSSAAATTSPTTGSTRTATKYFPEFTINSSDIIRLILGYLTNIGLHQSAEAIRQESGIGYIYGLISSTLPNQIQTGQWDEVSKALALYQYNEEDNNEEDDGKKYGAGSIKAIANKLITLVQEQMILELAEYNETFELSWSIFRIIQSNLQDMKEDEDEDEGEENDNGDNDEKERKRRKNKKGKVIGGERLSKARSLEMKLNAIAGHGSKYPSGSIERLSLLYSSNNETSGVNNMNLNGLYQKRQQRRNRLAQEFTKTQPLIPLGRLTQLIQQAMKWQAYTGQLPYIKEIIHEEHDDDDDDDNEDERRRRRRRRKRRKTKHLDLVLGTNYAIDYAPTVGDETDGFNNNDDDDDEETMLEPTLVSKVKFGKSAVCESATFFPHGLITGSSDGLIEIWDPSTSYQKLNVHDYPFQNEEEEDGDGNENGASFMGHDHPVLSLVLSNDYQILVSGDGHGLIKVWKLQTGQCLKQFYVASTGTTINSLDLTSDGSRLLAATSSSSSSSSSNNSSQDIVREFSLLNQHVIQEYVGHTSYVNSCQYVLQMKDMTKNHDEYSHSRNDGKLWVVTGSSDGTVRVWDPKSGGTIIMLQSQTTIDVVPGRKHTKKSNNKNKNNDDDDDDIIDSLLATTAASSTSSSSSNSIITLPAIVAVLAMPDNPTQLLIVPRFHTAYLVDMLSGKIIQRYVNDKHYLDHISSSSKNNVTKEDVDGNNNNVGGKNDDNYSTLSYYCAASFDFASTSTVSSSSSSSSRFGWIYLVTSGGDCLIFSRKTGQLKRTISNFTSDSTYPKKTATSTSINIHNNNNNNVELTNMLFHPYKKLVAAYSNDKGQKKGIISIWK